METPDGRPRLAVLVADGITGDSDVRTIAVAAARDGWDVALIGRSDTKRVQRSRMGHVEVIRVPVGSEYLHAVNARRGPRAVVHHAWVRQKSAESAWAGGTRRTLLKALLRARRALYRLRVRAHMWRRRRRGSSPADGGRAQAVQLDLAYGPVIEELEPDVIHASDATSIVAAAQSAARLKGAGHGCAWLYDEHAQGEVEREGVGAEFIGRADAVAPASTPASSTKTASTQVVSTQASLAQADSTRTVSTPAVSTQASSTPMALAQPADDCGPLLRLYRQVSGLAPSPRSAEVYAVVRETPAAIREAAPTAPDGRSGWRKLADTPVRLGLGPANHAGQGAAYARAITRNDPGVSVEVVMNKRASSTFDYPADVYADVTRLREVNVQLALLERVVSRYTHLLVDAFMPVFGHLNGTSVRGDLPALEQAGIKVALLAHGSEIRHPRRHMRRHPYSLFRDAPDGVADTLQATAERNRRIADEAGLPLFVTTPDLLDDLPTATWAPLVVDVASWASGHPVMERRRPVVLHAPSKRWTKGSDRILPTLTELHDRGVIEFRLAEGVPWSKMRELVRTCDLVLDQFTTGSYGTFAVEAMAAGRPVVAAISDEVKAATDGDLPIVSATPDTLREVVLSLVADREAAARIGRESVAFARAYHDGTRTARVLSGFLGR